MSPLISIIVTTYLAESKIYLDACIKSIFNLDYDNFEVILIGRPSYQPIYDKVKTVVFPKDDFGNSEGINYGVKHASPNAAAYFILNDDVILTKDSLGELVAVGADMIVGPISNCDQGIKYYLMGAFDVATQFRLNQGAEPSAVAETINLLSNKRSPYPRGLIIQTHLYFYAVYIPKMVWDKLGSFGEQYKTGPDDLDYSRRAQHAGVRMGIVLSSLVWHASGATADKTITPELRESNAKAWKETWGDDQPFSL